MTKAEVLEALKQMTTEKRLEVIETASRLVREELVAKSKLKIEPKLSLAEAAEVMRPFYQQGSELAMFTDENIEDFYEYEDYA
ncbi:MAG: hypothetical protein SAK29_16930 [Scytonema sp. PMC 1069.18]|nr:hypothetical protein [Scytonema sp. PMC 1069.18]MEC4887640.1 hypothetical protein [Scytonema sp. PMC 1070.18]